MQSRLNRTPHSGSLVCMVVKCAHCGETLMGSVNRCWQCGKEFESRTGPAETPPLRRPPIVGPLDGPLEAVVVAPEPLDPAESSEVTSQPDRWQRRGSPFAVKEVDVVEAEGAQFASDIPKATVYPRALGASGGGIAAIVLACISVVVVFLFPFGGLVLTAVGLGLGVWGLRAPRRGPAIVGLVLCC